MYKAVLASRVVLLKPTNPHGPGSTKYVDKTPDISDQTIKIQILLITWHYEVETEDTHPGPIEQELENGK